MKKILFLLLVLLSACTQISPEELQQQLTEANSNIDSYSMDIDMDMIMSSGDTVISTQVTSTGSLDRKNKKMMMTGSVTSTGDDAVNQIDTETYIIGNTVYSKAMNLWMKMQIQEDLWEQQDQISQITELLSSGDLDIISQEEDHYVVKIEPDLEKVVEMMMKQQQRYDLLQQNMDYADMVKSYSSNLWVNKETFIIDRSSTSMTMVLDGSSFNQDEDIEMQTDIDVKISDINKEMDIELPAEAENAVDMSTIEQQA